ncbi:MAG: hypothetical protein WBV06_19445 [Acidimicrobiia bacterium]|jgi:hypothetical protein
MDDTQSVNEEDRTAAKDLSDPVAELGALDPAQAPQAAERYAAALEDDLEKAGVAPREPEQMQADLGASTDT